MIQGGVLAALRRPDGGVQTAPDTYLRIGTECGIPSGVETPYGGEQSQKPLLNQILTVSARQKQGAGASPNQPAVAAYQLRLPTGVALSCISA